MSTTDSSNGAHENSNSIDAIEKDLADVETALARLEAGTYWTDEVSGDPIPDDVLAANPLTRRKA